MIDRQTDRQTDRHASIATRIHCNVLDLHLNILEIFMQELVTAEVKRYMQIGVGLYIKHIYKQLSEERTQENSELSGRESGMSVTYTCHVTSVSPQTRMWANAQRDGRPAEHRWHPVFQTAKFGWRPLLECRAVTLPSRETRLNLEGCPKLPNRSQPLVGRSSPYYQDMWRRYHCLTGFFPIVDTSLSCEDTARQSCVMVPRWRFFCVMYFQRAACSTFQTCILNSH